MTAEDRPTRDADHERLIAAAARWERLYKALWADADLLAADYRAAAIENAELMAENARLRAALKALTDAHDAAMPYMRRFTDATYEPRERNVCFFCGTERYQPHREDCVWANIKRTWAAAAAAAGVSVEGNPDGD